MTSSRGEIAPSAGCASPDAMCRWRDRAFVANSAVGDQDLLEHACVSASMVSWTVILAGLWVAG
jgi:hypothetical protein